MYNPPPCSSQVLAALDVTPKYRSSKLDCYAQYESHLLSNVSSAISWQLSSLRSGFFSILPRSRLRSLGVTSSDLRLITCGTSGGSSSSEDFDFREYFQVVTDTDLSSSPLNALLWSVISSLSPAEKRKLLKFITASSNLPLPGSEFLTVELPFLPQTVSDHRKMLCMVPQSHTCDNILELPNYYQAAVAVRESEGRSLSGVEVEVKTVLLEKIRVAIDNADGYGLDAVDETGAGAGEGLGELLGRDEENLGGGEEEEGSFDDFDIPELGGSEEEKKEEKEEKKEVVKVSKVSGEMKGGESDDESEAYSDDDYSDESFGSVELP